jgi:polar amino acid transport system substrate-binding protein
MCSVLLLIFSIMPSYLFGAESIRVVTDAWPPYVFEEQGTMTGFDYEVMQAVMKRMGYSVEFRLMPWKRCLQMIESGQADALLDVSITEERKRSMIFPSEPLSDSASVLFHRRGQRYRFNTLEDLRGLRIGTIAGYEYNKEFLEADYIFREPVADLQQNIRKLMNGRIDLFISNRRVGLYALQRAGALDAVAYLPKPVSGGEVYLAFTRTDANRVLAKKFSESLRTFKGTKEYRDIHARYGQR